MHAADGEPAAAGGEDLVGDAADVVAEQLGLFAEGREDGADGVVGDHLLESQLELADLVAVDAGAVAGWGHVGAGLSEAVEERGFEGAASGAEEALRPVAARARRRR